MADQQQEKPAHLEPSELGTKEYWDNLYVNEISNHAHDPDDKGTVWFDDSDAEAKMIAFLNKLDPDFAGSDSGSDSDDGEGEEEEEEEQEARSRLPRLYQSRTTFLDLGTGNGSLLFGLRDAGWQGKMLGVDYSPKSVEFAKQIARSRRRRQREERDGEDDGEGEGEGEDGGGAEGVEFREYDILNGRPETLLPSAIFTTSEPSTTTTTNKTNPQEEQGWDVILDKGTFDAISLYSSSSSSTTQEAGTRRPNEGYKAAVLPLVREGGLFLITSCNWTEDELSRWFEGDYDSDQQQQDQQWRFRQVGKVQYPTFSFGGVKGQTISTLCFAKMRR
ncbi:uncharacterized protein B0I36DRAFT_359469 [Microdochium trichocladiopsis]|uniref:Protein-lysine N-methyltransferase EFM4 n=1 Tax=Microdochium trichocladiopsis TaxID=1682393 RepID=A0A9P9BUU4_9PEZI|nr:uncharacterized protein B0I36DRAFT_359469 [Microdochium trichocladiopsis]KAH7037829.1 hypothetical protein B0I36DRAFT_359469 [Microdochium trichocladiopsis]